ncbi:MAG: type II toxin-antitoxin system RelB/DinJ family antitoxin [Leptospirales bacterium]
MKDATVRARIDGSTKKKAEKILHKLGLSTSEAINVYFNQILLNNGLPFELKVPNNQTKKVFKESENRKNLVKAKNADDMFDKLGI